jgi:hypothetical protein
MADWSLPGLTDLYTNILTYFKGRDDDAVRVNDTRATAATNLPTYAKRWNNTAKKWESWSGSAWVDETLSIQGGGTGGASGSQARTNLDVYQKSAAETMVDGKITTHNSITATPHGAVPTATASKIIVRDSAGRAAVATPSASTDIATKGYVDGLAGVSWTYNPVLTPITNVSSVVQVGSWHYHRNGQFVAVFGTAYPQWITSGQCQFNISLPIASDLRYGWEVQGVAVERFGNGGYLSGDATNNAARVLYTPSSSGVYISFSFSYMVL